MALTVLAHVGVQVLLRAELVCELFGAEAFPELTLLSRFIGADLHFLVVHHA